MTTVEATPSPATGARRRTTIVAVLGMIGWAAVAAAFPGREVYVPLALYSGALSLVLLALDRRPGRFRITPRALAIGVVGAAVMIAGSYAAFAAASSVFPFVTADVHADYVRTGIAHNWSVVPLLFVVIAAEEIIWREVLFDPERPLKSGLISVALYTATQIALGSWVVLALAFVCGALWTLERAYAKGLVAPIVTHAIWNITVLVAWPMTEP